MKSTIKSILEKFKGIEVFHIHHNNNIWIIDFVGSCPFTFSYIVSEFYQAGGVVHIYADQPYSFIYWANLPNDSVKALLDNLTSMLNESDNLVSEKIEDIEQFSKLSKRAKNKYVKFVKFLRRETGHENLDARHLLEHIRTCSECGSHSYSKADEMRAVLEFRTPERAFNALIRHD